MLADHLLDVIDDLEQQAEGLALAERDLEVADRSRAEYAAVTLASRVHAAQGRRVRLDLLGGLRLDGVVVRTGVDWLLLADAAVPRSWVVPYAGLAALRGVSARALPDAAIGVARRLPMRAVLRRLSDDSADCVVHLRDGNRLDGRLLRLGADFAELRLAGPSGGDGLDLVPLAAVAAVTFD